MKLLEYEGKALLREAGVLVPEGTLWSPAGDVHLPRADKYVVKAQVHQKHRAQQGGVVTVSKKADISRVAAGLMNLSFEGERCQAVYVEQFCPSSKEVFFAITVDREAMEWRLVASQEGGIEIETVDSGRIASVAINPLTGFHGYHARALTELVGLVGADAQAVATLVERAFACAVHMDVELLEINPILLTTSGTAVAGDAKVTLDDDARWKHPEWEEIESARPRDRFVESVRALGSIGVRFPRSDVVGDTGAYGGVAVIANGAGVTMAACDLVTRRGGVVCGALELHGALAQGLQVTAEVIQSVGMLQPGAVLINGFYQLRSCADFAAAILLAFRAGNFRVQPERVVIRMRGKDEEQALTALTAAGLRCFSSLEQACTLAADIAASPQVRPE